MSDPNRTVGQPPVRVLAGLSTSSVRPSGARWPGYRRYEWKCDRLNAPSRQAATRLGFLEEGTWRNALIVKGHNRDTTWFSVTDDEWPHLRAAFDAWLTAENLDADGRQLRSLSSLR